MKKVSKSMLAKSVQYTPENRKGAFKKNIYLEQQTKFKETLWNSEKCWAIKIGFEKISLKIIFLIIKKYLFSKVQYYCVVGHQ